MARWRFYQGLRTEWRWYQLDESGDVIAQSDQGFAELQGCMANAETAGFTREAFQVYTRQAGSYAGDGSNAKGGSEDDVQFSPPVDAPDNQPAP